MIKIKKIAGSAALIAAMMMSLTATGCEDKNAESSQAADVLVPTEAATQNPNAQLPDIEAFSAEPCGMSGRARSLRTINDEVIGYISIPETYVDYPVTQCGDNDAYMHTDIYGGYLDSGTIFMDYRDIFVPDESKQSNNIVLYGHNMLNGTKFASLHHYRQDDSLYAKSPIIEFSSNYVDYKYVIFAYFLTSGSYGDSAYGEEFAYWDMENMDEKQFNEYVKTCRERSMISPDIDVKYGDQIITLQTCHMDEDNSRFLVIGRRLRDDETPEDFMNISSAAATTESAESSDSEAADE